jgi:hypothetical protein
MNKLLLGLVLGGVLGAVDGLSALLSAPETRPAIVGIVIGSTFKGIAAGLLIGWFGRKVHSMKWGVVFGFAIGLVLAFIIAAMPNEDGSHYWWEIMLPGSIVGLIVGYATQRYGVAPAAQKS